MSQRLTDIYGDMDGLRSAADRAEEIKRRSSEPKAILATITGPYHYKHEVHPCFRIDTEDRYIGSIAIHGDDEEAAYELAEAVLEAIQRQRNAGDGTQPSVEKGGGK